MSTSSSAEQSSDESSDDFDFIEETNHFKSNDSVVNFVGASSNTDLSLSDSSSENDHSESPNGKSYLFLLMEYCSNRTLKDEIYLTGEGSLSVDRAWSLVRDTLEGLKYIHGLRNIHRDLKPGNIFLDAQGRAKIGDFGLATEMENRIKLDQVELKGSESESVTRAGGTRIYIAPECLDVKKGRVKVTSKVDMFALGIIVFEIFCKIFCNMKDDRDRLINIRQLKINDQFPERFTDDSIKDIIRRLINTEPKKRYTASQLLADPKLKLIQSHLIQDITQLRETIKASCQRFASPHHEAMVQEMFNIENGLVNHETYYSSLRDTQQTTNRTHRLAQLILSLFQSRGHIYTHAPLFIPVDKETENEVAMIDTSGLKVTLGGITQDYMEEETKSVSQIAQFYPDKLTTRCHPLQHTIVNARVNGCQSAVQPMIELLSSLRRVGTYLRGEIEIHINHATLVDIVLSFHNKPNSTVNNSSRQKLKRELVRLSKTNRSDSQIMRKNFPKLADYNFLSADISNLVERYKSLAEPHMLHEIQKIATELTQIESTCRDLLPLGVKFIHRQFLASAHGHYVVQVWNTNSAEKELIVEGDGTLLQTTSNLMWKISVSYFVSRMMNCMSELPQVTIHDPKVMLVSQNAKCTELVTLLALLEDEQIGCFLHYGQINSHGSRSLRKSWHQHAMGRSSIQLIIEWVDPTQVIFYTAPFEQYISRGTKQLGIELNRPPEDTKLTMNYDSLKRMVYRNETGEFKGNLVDSVKFVLSRDNSNSPKRHISRQTSDVDNVIKCIEYCQLGNIRNISNNFRYMNTWKTDQKDKLEKIVQSHPIYASVQNLCIVVVSLPPDIIKTIGAFLGILRELKCQ